MVSCIYNNSLTVDSANGFNTGDSALLIQMKGAAVDRSDTQNHGDVTNYGSAGRFEFVEIATSGGNNIVLTTNPNVAFQTAGIVQLIRIERYTNKILTGTISGMPWNGKKGGVVAIDDTETLTLNGTIDVTGLGFLGGELTQTIPFIYACTEDQTNYTGPLQPGTGNKGEGVIVDATEHRARRGHNANGGGGGNITDAGGGGGGNFGAGGIGGRELALCDRGGNFGGLGGQSLDYTPMNRLFMGGGGGSGSEVDQAEEGGARAGGGIVIIRARKLISNGGAILAKGLSSNNDDGNGADGGGAGGSIGLILSDSITGSPEIEVQGGAGGDENNRVEAHGTGGGGGGGTVVLNGLNCDSVHWTAEGGEPGRSKLGTLDYNDPHWGAASGETGSCITNFTNIPHIGGGTSPTTPDLGPPSPSMDVKACQAVTPLSSLPDGKEDLTFPKGYWATSYYEGTDGVKDAIYLGKGLNDQGYNGSGNNGQKKFKGEAFWGVDGKAAVSIRSNGSEPDKGWSQLETPTSPKRHHPNYAGDSWASTGNPFYQIDMRQKMTFGGELKLEYGDEFIADFIEVIVNGVRAYGFFPSDQRATIKLKANDDVIVRYMNWGSTGNFNIDLSSPMPDCSDSPEDGTTNASGNINNYGSASHSVFSAIRLGATVDGESESIASNNADGDGTDDDGVTFSPMTPGSLSTITVTVSGANALDVDGFLQAWIDWNGDGDFDDPNEQIARDIQDSAENDTETAPGVIAFNTLVPDMATTSPTFMRFRWSTMSGLLSTGPAADGESEDYQVSISGNPMSCDMNFLAHDIYPTGSVSANSDELSSDTLVYQATFDNKNWQGKVTAYSLKTTDNDGNIKSAVWNTGNTMSRSGRDLFTYKPVAKQGQQFIWKALQRSQKLALRAGDGWQMGKARLAWVRGSAASEGNSGPLRKRENLLGDIVHPNLNFRSRYTNFGYKRLSSSEGNSYASYLVAKRSTKDTLFVGANDGMLHAFNAKNGNELFAYVPNEVIPKLATISNPKYGCDASDCLPHEYLVDGKTTIADAYFNDKWHNVLIGTLGLGGKAIYALDVSKPSEFATKDVLWEISDTQAPSDASFFSDHMGMSISEPVVVKMKDGTWVAVVANGYDSKNHQAVLFIIDIETGKLLKSINTGVGSVAQKNGLSSPTAVDSDGDYIADIIYAGDLQGNLWAFDVNSEKPASWGIKQGEAIFRACMNLDCSKPKPITAKPQVGRNPAGGLMVYFGTGKYTNLGDNFDPNENGVIDTFYGLHDNDQIIDSNNLVEQKILQEIGINADMRSRVTSKNDVMYPDKHGWYMDLVTPPSAKDDGERVISQALLRNGRLIFVTLAPSQSDCAWSGSSWLMELNAIDGSRLSVIPIDINDDKQFTVEDNVDYQGNSTIISGVQKPSLGMVFESPAIISHSTQTEGKYQTGTSGKISMLRESSSRFTGRMSWRKIR